MDVHEIRQQLRTKSLFDLPLRVTFYARVSSDSDEQLNSLDNQIGYYEDLISRNKNWTYVTGYIDEGISGISTRKRENFNRMIDDSANDMFDLVLTKEISRFARNTLDSIQYTRQLLSNNVGVFFQNDNINTFDDDSELRLSIMSSIAQDELRKLSSRIKFGHQQAIKNGVVLGNSRIFGYKKDGKKLVIDDEQAVMIRELFELYSTDQYSMKQIEKIFWDKGYRNNNGNKIAHSTMANIISNAKYKGYYVGNKVKVVDMFTKKQKFLPPEDWVMFKDETGEVVPAIVSEEIWDKANDILKRRSDDVKYRQGICNHANLLTGKMYCTHCGTAYYRKDSIDKNKNKNSKWVCSGKIKNGTDSCDSVAIFEREIIPILFDVFYETCNDTDSLINKYIEIYKSMTRSSDIEKAIAEQERIIDLANRKKMKLLEYNASGSISDKDFLSMNAECEKEVSKAQEEISSLEGQLSTNSEFEQRIKSMRDALKAAQKDIASGTITKDFVNKYIDRIFVTPLEDGCMQLDIRLFTGKTTSKKLGIAESCMGHTSKKMIDAYKTGSNR